MPRSEMVPVPITVCPHYCTIRNGACPHYPDSIKGLELYLVGKELGERAIGDEIEEFSRIVQSTQHIQEESKLLDEYKRKNPFTWNEIENEKGDDSHYSLYGFLMAADHLNKNPGKKERLMRL